MKPILSISLFLFFISMFSCDNEPLESALEDNQTLVLKSITSVLIDSPNSCTGREGRFNEQGRIIGIYICGLDSPSRVHTYTESGQINSISGYGAYIYENDILVARSGGTDATNFYTTINYNNNIIEEHSTYNQVESNNFRKYVFEDDTYNKLLEYSFINNEGIEEEITHRVTFEYEANNVVAILVEQKTSNDLVLEPKTSINFNYDDKINPYKLGLPESAYMLYGTPLLYTEGESILVRLADNNMVNSTVTNLVENTSYNRTFEYNYNDEMYPILATESINGIPRVDFIYEYY